MEPDEYAGTFRTSGDAYFSFMGRYSEPLAALFADFVGVVPGQTALDVGCGPGALTRELVDRLGAGAVSACDPSPSFVAECMARCAGVDVRAGRAEVIPFDDATFDAALAQLVFHFVADPTLAVGELRRVVRPGGVVGACVWDSTDGMEMLRHFWAAALAVGPSASDEAGVLRLGREAEIADLFLAAGIDEVAETTLRVSSEYEDFDELWSGFLAGIGPTGTFCMALSEEKRADVRARLFGRLGSPAGRFSLTATARSAAGRVPA